MPVAVPLRPLSPLNDTATEEENVELETDYDSEDQDDDMEYEDSGEEDDEDDFEEFGGVSVSLNGIFYPRPPRSNHDTSSQDPFSENFLYQETRGLGNGQCSHPPRPTRFCRHCPAKFSPAFYTSFQLMYQSIFGDKVAFSRANPQYQAKYPSAHEPFKAITAMHDPSYIRRLFEEIVHYIGFLQNQQARDGKFEKSLKTKLFWLYEFVERLFLSLQEQSSTEELVLIGTFRAQLKAIGLCSRFDENVQLNRSLAQECQR